VRVAADSVGQRFLAIIALADTTANAVSPESRADSIVTAWVAGSRTLPAGWKALTVLSQDAWDSDQYRAGHGLVPADPIKWGWDWTGAGATTFYERTDSDPLCNTY
jgi:hypothetical protein